MKFMDKTVIQLVTYLRVQNRNLFFPNFATLGRDPWVEIEPVRHDPGTNSRYVLVAPSEDILILL